MPNLEDGDPGDVRNLVALEDEQTIAEASRLFSQAKRDHTLVYEEKTVRLDSLTTRQDWVTKHKLESMDEGITGHISGLASEYDGGVRAIVYQGKIILVDGNHRVNLAILRGQKTMRIRVAKVD